MDNSKYEIDHNISFTVETINASSNERRRNSTFDTFRLKQFVCQVRY